MITGPEPGLTRDAVATDFTWGGRPIRLFDTAGLRRKARDQRDGREARRQRCRARHPLRRGGGAADRCRASLRAPGPHDRRSRGGRGARSGHRRQQVGSRHATSRRSSRSCGNPSRTGWRRLPGVSVVAISALADLGLDRLMSEVFRSYEIWNRRVPTPHLNRWLAEALERHAPPASKGRRVKIRFMTQASARPPTFVAFCAPPRSTAPGLPALPHQQPARGLRSAGRAHPHQAAQGRQSVRAGAAVRLRAPYFGCLGPTRRPPLG